MVDSSFETGLKARLEQHNAYFNDLIKIIPAKYYLANDTQDGSWMKYGHNKKNKAPKQEIKEGSKKAKKAKLDPEQKKTVLDIQQELAEQQKREKETAATNGDVSDGDEDDSEAEGEEEEEMAEADSVRPKFNANPASSIEELKQRLADRIASLRGKRKVPSGAEGQPPPKRAKPEKKKKEATAPAPKQERISHKTKGGFGGGEGGGDGAVVYSKFDFSAIEKQKKNKNKDYKQLLAKAESNKAKIEELKKSDPEKAKEVVAKQKQRKAMEMAMGIKQADDPTLLKKSIKRQEKQKEKSKKAWKARDKQVKTDMAKRQQKRRENIDARIQGKKDKRINQGKKPKRPQQRPGFEGKSSKKR